MDAFNWFVFHRGVLSKVYCDHGRNFVAAAKSLDVDCNFITPCNPHQEGLWGAAVRSAKSHLLRVAKGNFQPLETYVSLFTATEGILNSRP